MTERDIQFNEDEKVGIAQAAREAARIGEDMVWELVHAKVELMKLALKGVGNGVAIDNVVYTSSQIMHEAEVIEEVIDQARVILQFEGRDLMGELSKHAEEVGWGSVFDPDSEISKRLKDVFGR